MNQAEFDQEWHEYDKAAQHKAKHEKLPDSVNQRVVELIGEDPEEFESRVRVFRYALEMAAIAPMDDLVSSVTAFNSWDEYQESLNGGYVPTLSQSNIEMAELAERLKSRGYQVFMIA